MVVEGAPGTSRTVSFSFTTPGSFTMVVEEEGVADEGAAERSQPASVAMAKAARTGIITYLIEISS
jgi:hypothetical protein